MPALDLVLPGDPATLTGGYLYDRRIVEGLSRLGWTTRVLTLPDDFPCASPASLRAAEEVLDALPAHRTVVVDGLALADLAGTLERHSPRLALVALVHHPLADETGLDDEAAARLRRDERRAWHAARGVIVTSRWTSRRLAAAGFPAERIRVVEPGTDRRRPDDRRVEPGTDRRRPDDRRVEPRDVRPKLGDDRSEPGDAGSQPGAGSPLLEHHDENEPYHPPRLLCVATLTQRKGHIVLLDALARIADRPWRLDCVGSTTRDPSATASIRARIVRHGLAERVVLHGEVSPAALDALYRGAHAFVLPSYLEGYGMALADALVHGLPIIGTHAGAIPETIGDAGILAAPGDAGALAGALVRVLDDEALHTRLSAHARDRARTLPTWSDASARFAAAVDDLVGKRQSEIG